MIQSNKSLAGWLDELALRHPQHTIRLGLDSMRLAMSRLALRQPQARVVTIAGTNGKGTCLMLLEAMLVAKGVRVGSFQSPHISHFCERIRISGKWVSEGDITNAFELIDAHCNDINLTFFEWNTLAALIIFAQHELDIVLLEIGLGGRLDAVNVVDNDLALITAIDFDHTDWLGDSLEQIASEKAGVIRLGSMVVSHSQIAAIVTACNERHAKALFWQKDFYIERRGQQCLFSGMSIKGDRVDAMTPLPSGCIEDNLALALQAWLTLGYDLTDRCIKKALVDCILPGRQQHIRFGGMDVILDVAHNRAGLVSLAAKIASEYGSVPAVALVGMLADKEAVRDMRQLFPSVCRWVLISLTGARGQTAAALADKLCMTDCVLIDDPDVLDVDEVLAGNRLLIAMGSFHTCDTARSMLVRSGYTGGT